MKTTAKVLGLVLAASLPLFAQLATWTSSNGKEQYTGTYNGYDYELWNQNGSGSATMKVTGNSTNGGTFEAQWSNTCNVLFRSGKKWGSNSNQNHTQIGNITIDFEAEWSSPDNVKYLSVYGWAYFTQANTPSNFSNQIEYYIVQDRGSYNPCNNKKGSAVIDGISYGFHVCDRMNQPMLTGNGNFKQFFSIPENTSNHRRSGKISVSEHFKAWHAAGMYMDGPMYEVAMKIESYKCDNNNGSGSGEGKVTKNILTIGGSLPSSNSGGGTSSANTSNTSSSSQAKTQATTCKTPLITYPTSTVPSDPYTACFKHSNDKCYVCKISSEGEHEGNMNTCASSWVWDGTQLESNLTSGYWYQEVPCPTGSSSSAVGTSSSSSSNRSSSSAINSSSSSSNRSSSSVTNSSSSSSNRSSSSVTNSSSSGSTAIIFNKTPLTQFSVRTNGKALLVEASAPATIVVYNLSGKKEATFNVSGTQTVDTSLPSGMYFATVHGVSAQHVRFIIK